MSSEHIFLFTFVFVITSFCLIAKPVSVCLLLLVCLLINHGCVNIECDIEILKIREFGMLLGKTFSTRQCLWKSLLFASFVLSKLKL